MPPTAHGQYLVGMRNFFFSIFLSIFFVIYLSGFVIGGHAALHGQRKGNLQQSYAALVEALRRGLQVQGREQAFLKAAAVEVVGNGVALHLAAHQQQFLAAALHVAPCLSVCLAGVVERFLQADLRQPDLRDNSLAFPP